jgi:hypothetical protein
MPKPIPDLRTSVIPLEVQRIANIQPLKEQAEKWWNIRRMQGLFPSMEELFKLESLKSPYQFGLKSRTPIQTITGIDKIYTNGAEIEIHKKMTMILPAYKVMRGDFGTSGLPSEKENASEEHRRIQSPHNAAYVGSLANVALATICPLHFPEVYGSFTGLATKHSIDISDDYADLADRPWFLQNLGHFFDLKLKSFSQLSQEPLTLGDDIELDAEELEPIMHSAIIPAPMSEYSDITDEEDIDSDSISTGYVFGIRTCSSNGSRHQDGIAFEEDEESFAEATFHDTPVQITIMQKCENTMFHLFKHNTETHKRVAWIAQIVFALAYAQRTLGFVHNDLHVNNVMYVPTDTPYFYYNAGGRLYRVPTYGYNMKLIDFDRATFSVKLSGMRESRFFMSDHFDIDEDAGGQYNTPPFYNTKFSEVKPNPSFDLVRLATSIFWDCFPEGPLHESYKNDALFKILMQWTTLPDGKSILFRNLEEKDTHERYSGFHLYKAIARYCKNTAVPRTQIEKLASPYLCTERLPPSEPCLIIES